MEVTVPAIYSLVRLRRFDSDHLCRWIFCLPPRQLVDVEFRGFLHRNPYLHCTNHYMEARQAYQGMSHFIAFFFVAISCSPQFTS